MRMLFLAALTLPLLTACATGRNYVDPDGPRYAGVGSRHAEPSRRPDEVRVVTFNIEFGREVDAALEVLTSEPDLRDPDVLLLQEMDEPSVRRIADALGLRYAYYPATFSLRSDRDFGNAVLSPWPILSDEKLVLPHLGAFSRTQRIATGATLQIAETPVRVYSIHLATLVQMLPSARRDQLQTVLDDAASFDHVIIGGDLNTQGLGRVAVENGYATPTEEGPGTTALGRWDHIFLKGFVVSAVDGTGTVEDVRGSSDHRPVWAVAKFVARVPRPDAAGYCTGVPDRNNRWRCPLWSHNSNN